MTSKEQERKALEQIKKIVEGLGADSYIATAMDGMIEDAEENIENDFCLSMKERWESEMEEANKYRIERDNLKQEVESWKRQAEANHQCALENEEDLKYIASKKDEYKEAMTRECNAKVEAENKVAELEDEIIRLKAKLYDLITK